MADKKEQLYRAVRRLKMLQFLNPEEYRIDVIQYVKNQDVQVEVLDYKTRGFCGIAIPGTEFERDTILLKGWPHHSRPYRRM